MARSSYVYALTNRGGEPAHAFTVKHELVTFMCRNPEGLETRTVFRMPDGLRASYNTALAVYSWPAADFLAEHG